VLAYICLTPKIYICHNKGLHFSEYAPISERPPPPQKLHANEVKESSVHITWVPPDLDHMYAISGYVLQYKVFGDNNWVKYDVVKGDNYVIQGLQGGTGYQIRTKAANKFGHSEPSESLEITTLDKGITLCL